MSLYTKGPWARFTFDTQHMKVATEALGADPMTLFKASAFFAKTRLLTQGVPATAGINPPGIPRADEQEPFERPMLEKYYHPAVQAAIDAGSETPWIIMANEEEVDLTEDCRFGADAAEFYLNPEKTQMGFWLVLHETTDLDDKNSLREQLAAEFSGRPFKALSKVDQKGVNEELVNKMKTYAKRTQAAVMIDVARGELWVGTSSKKVIEALIAFFADSVVLNRLSLNFAGESGWLSAFLGEIVSKDLYKLEHEEMVDRALAAEAAEPEGEDESEETWGGEEGRRIERDARPTETPEGDGAPEYPAGSDCIAVLNLDQTGYVINLDVPAVLAPTADSDATIGVREFIDALLVLKAMPGSHVGSGVATLVDKGGSSCTVEVSAALVTGPTLTWRGLAPSVKLQDLPAYDDDQSGMLYHWRVWFDTLRYCEKMIVEAICYALELDPMAVNNGVVATSGQTASESIDLDEVSHDKVAAGLKGMAQEFRQDLKDSGITSMTLTTGASSTVIDLED